MASKDTKRDVFLRFLVISFACLTHCSLVKSVNKELPLFDFPNSSV